MNSTLTFGAALLLGLAASGHCLVMCGGITAALGVATARGVDGRPRPSLLIGYQLGRIVSYSLAGLLLSGMLGGLIALLDIESVRRTLRALSALALLLAALVAFGRMRDPSLRFGIGLWRRLAPLGRRLLPIASLPRAFAFGMVWGWMPCGFVYSRPADRHVATERSPRCTHHGGVWSRHCASSSGRQLRITSSGRMGRESRHATHRWLSAADQRTRHAVRTVVDAYDSRHASLDGCLALNLSTRAVHRACHS